MRRNVIETVMGGVVLIVAAMFVGIAFQSGTVTTSAGYRIIADFGDASGLGPGSEVRMSGVKIGTVHSLELDPNTYDARATLNISESVNLPRDTSARIIADGLLGSNFIALEPGGDEEMLQSGEAIDITQGSINVVDLLGRFIWSDAEAGCEKSAQ